MGVPGFSTGLARRSTWTPKVCKIMAFMAILMGLGLLFYILLGFRYHSDDSTHGPMLLSARPEYTKTNPPGSTYSTNVTIEYWG